ncbi:MAG: Rho termination factor N-terminal domain-containing protein, partial [Acidimicrobiales bacterium]
IDCHVDGFRFDLASALAREFYDVDRLSAFFDVIHQDPVLSQVKLIAEPWDVGPGGYQVGNFPILWTEWNGKYRDCIRDFWRGQPSTLGEFAYRITGSSDLYESSGRRPLASINFVTAHDGFTLVDLVSYNDKHNEANGEGNADGENHNRSWDCGVEGPTDAPEVLALRVRQQRNLLATLLLSQGTPMLLAGDEMGRSQGGNNNAYCQDNVTSWFDWDDLDGTLVAFTRRLIDLRRHHPVFRRRRFFQGESLHSRGAIDLAWFRPDGAEMTDEDWEVGDAIAVFLNGEAIPEVDERGEPIVDDVFVFLFNAHHDALDFTLPPERYGEAWVKVLDTADSFDEGSQAKAGEVVLVEGRSLVLLRRLGVAYGHLTVTELRQMARAGQVPGAAKMRKPELIAALRARGLHHPGSG